jgi:hypothetical protein
MLAHLVPSSLIDVLKPRICTRSIVAFTTMQAKVVRSSVKCMSMVRAFVRVVFARVNNTDLELKRRQADLLAIGQ